jgi:hypothetical protein
LANVECILLTGGALELGSAGGKKLGKMLVDDVQRMASKSFESTTIIKSDHPHVGSIMNGAKTMFAMP